MRIPPCNSKSKGSLGPGDWRRCAARGSAYALMFVAFLIGLSYVRAFGVNVFWRDDWARSPILSEYFSGTLTAADFWELNNEHRIVFPRLVMLGLGLLTQGNVVADMYVIQVLLLAILTIFIVAFRQQFHSGPAIWLMVPMAFLVFSLRQYENMLWGFQIGFVMVVVAALATFLALSRIRNERYAWMFGSAIVAATVAAFSSLHGLLVWPVGLGQLLIAPLTKRLKIILMTLWATLGAGEWLVYFLDWVKPEAHPAVGFSWRYLTAAIGGAVSGDETVALAAGVLISALTAAAVLLTALKRQWREHSFWQATIAFVLATLAMITAGRSGFGTAQALVSRYATVSIPLLVAIYVIFAAQSAKKLNVVGISLMSIVLLIAVVSTSVSLVTGWQQGRATRRYREYQQFAICTIDVQPDFVIKVFWSPDFVRQCSAVLKELGYSVFADTELCARYQVPDPLLPVVPAETRCGMSGAPVVADDNSLIIRGWAVDWPAGDVAGGVAVIFDNVAYPAFYGLQNDEAAKSLSSDKFLFCGFRCVVPAKDIRPGKHTTLLKVLTHDRKAVFGVLDTFEFETN
jgi:hypothetical protein